MVCCLKNLLSLERSGRLSRYSDEPQVRFPAAYDFSLLHVVQTGSVAHSASYTNGTGVLSQGGNRSRRETDQSPRSSAEVKKGGAIL
jgi:hypothetical protein